MFTYSELSKKGEAKALYKGKGSVSSGLFGAGKEGEELRILLNQLEIGPGILDSIVTNVSENKNKNAIGMPVGKFGIITLDYLHKHFYFSSSSVQTDRYKRQFLRFRFPACQR